MRHTILAFLLVGNVSVWAATSEANLFSEAESRYLGKNYAAALESYNEFIQQYPLSALLPDVQYRRAVCFYRLGRYRDASQLLKDVEGKYRATRYLSYVPFWQGLCLYQLQSYSLSVENLDVFLAGVRDPELSPQALLYKALSLVAVGEQTTAIEALRTITRDHRTSGVFQYSAVLYASLLDRQKSYDELLEFTDGIDASGFPRERRDLFLLSRADGLWEKGRTEEASALYRSLLDSAEDVAAIAYRRLFDAARQKGDLALMQDLTSAAESRFSEAPDVLADLWSRVGVESFHKGDIDAAKRFLEKVWVLRKTRIPGEAVPLYLAEIDLVNKDPDTARSILEEFVGLGGQPSANAVMRLGDIAMQQGDFASALKWYSRFLESFPDSPRSSEAGYLLAYVEYRLGKTDDSLAHVNRFLQAPTGPYTRELLRLQIALYRGKGSLAEASSSLSTYISRYPDETRARLDLLKVLFQRKDYSGIVREANILTARAPALQNADPYAFLLCSYLRGLAYIAGKDYAAAIIDLKGIGADAAKSAGLADIIPYAGYYMGWAYVKTGDLGSAARLLDSLALSYPGNELFSRILSLAAWSHFSLGEFDKAASGFSAVAGRESGTELGQKSLYLKAKSLFNAKKLPEAAAAFQAMLSAYPSSAYADSALFDYAGVLAAQGSTSKAAETYESMASRYPSSPLVEEAAYRRGEVYLESDMYAEAQKAFSDYRTRYPRGKFVDAALYWGGESAFGSGEKFGAVLLWEQLAQGFPASPLRGAAIMRSAEVYVDARDFPSALKLYNQLISEYPDEARAAKADIMVDQLRYQIQGYGDREAELTATISRESGKAKSDAILELARFYILSGDKKVEQGYQMIQPLVTGSDPAAAAGALSLMGEYYYRKGDLVGASRQFLAAAAKNPGSADFAASQIYRAAEMMAIARRQDDVAALVKRLVDNFPASPWTAKARTLQESGK
jgi:TolA-binding protein